MDLTPYLKPNKLLTPFQIVVGGPWYDVELGRLDGLSSTAASVEGMLPQPTENVLDRIHGVKEDPSINATYLPQLKELCPKDLDPHKEIFMDPTTPGKFDNVYYQICSKAEDYSSLTKLCSPILGPSLPLTYGMVVGPRYDMELGRFYGLSSMKASVEGKQPHQ
ncbi:hypothetical protein YC2023_000158 [Brassica napus]